MGLIDEHDPVLGQQSKGLETPLLIQSCCHYWYNLSLQIALKVSIKGIRNGCFWRHWLDQLADGVVPASTRLGLPPLLCFVFPFTPSPSWQICLWGSFFRSSLIYYIVLVYSSFPSSSNFLYCCPQSWSCLILLE